MSLAGGAIAGVDVETDGELVATELSFAGALTMTVRDALPVRPFGSVTV